MRSQAARIDCAPEIVTHAEGPGIWLALLDSRALVAFFSYLAVSLAIFGRAILPDPAGTYLGRGGDALLNVWFIGWWAHALAHHLNPFLTTAIWAPEGVNIAWTTNFPLAAWVAYPVTRIYGPVLASNVAHLVGLPLAGWAAFVLCRYLVSNFGAAWAGGCLFAFSPYMLTCMIGGGLFMLVFPIPLAVWITLRRLNGELRVRGFIAAAALLIAAQFLLSVEICASATMFGAIALAFATRTAPSEGARSRIMSILPAIVAAYGIAAVIVAPYLYYMLGFSIPEGAILTTKDNAADLLNFIVPTSLNQLGQVPLLAAVAAHFRADLSESRAYLGLPLLAIVWLFAREHWHEREAKLVVFMFAAACVLAMGPFLEIAGRAILPLPGAGLAALPLIEKALPARFMLYAYLAGAVLLAMWLGREARNPALRRGLAVAIVPFMLPSLASSMWATADAIPSFFRSGAYRHYIKPGEIVMILPYGLFGLGDLWQAETDFYFRADGGYVGYAPAIPAEHAKWPIMAGLYNVAGVPDAGEQLKAYLANHDVSAIIVGPRTHYLVARMGGPRIIDTWLLWPTIDAQRIATDRILDSLHVAPLAIGGVKLYRIPPQTLAPYRNLTALEMQRRMARARFETLLRAAERYLNGSSDPASLSPERVEQSGLLPRDWFGGSVFTNSANPHYFHLKAVLAESRSGLVEVGIEGDYDTLGPVIQTYRAIAGRIYFPYPAALSPASPPREPAMMVMTFDRAALKRAVAAAE